jgi:GABA permease
VAVSESPAPTRRDPTSVYRVIQLVGTSSESWEQAASNAIEEAAKSIGDLRVAQVVEIDTAVRDGRVAAYRIRLKVSYRIDRRRVTPTGETQVVRRYLVVANQTAGGPALNEAIRQRIAAGPSEFHVLVPATLSRDYAAARRLAFSVDPTAGYTFGDLSTVPRTDEEGQRRAQERLDEQLLQLIQAGASPTGEVGDSDPLVAIAAVLARSDFDELLLSTLPASASRWVRMDLPARLGRRYGAKVIHIQQADSP